MLAPYCEGESAEEPVVRLGLEAAGWWAEKTQAVNHRGTLVVTAARDKSDLSRFARRTTEFREIAGEEITALEPDLGERFHRGLFFANEAHLSPRDALSNLSGGLAADGAVFLQDDADPRSYAKHGLTIDCRGFQAKDHIPDLRGVKGEMVILSCPDVSLTRPIRLLHPRVPCSNCSARHMH
jgi:glycine oxidase